MISNLMLRRCNLCSVKFSSIHFHFWRNVQSREIIIDWGKCLSHYLSPNNPISVHGIYPSLFFNLTTLRWASEIGIRKGRKSFMLLRFDCYANKCHSKHHLNNPRSYCCCLQCHVNNFFTFLFQGVDPYMKYLF